MWHANFWQKIRYWCAKFPSGANFWGHLGAKFEIENEGAKNEQGTQFFYKINYCWY